MPKILVNQPTLAPTRKVVASTAGVAIANIVLVIVERIFPGVFTGIETEVHTLITTLVVFVSGYLVKDRAP